MIKFTWTHSIVLALTLTLLPLSAVDTTGRWQLKGEVAGNPIVADCNFKQDAVKLAGTCKAGESVTWIVAGEVQEKKVTFHHDVEHEGSTYTLNYTGTFESESAVKGDIEVSGASGEFTLTKGAGEAAKEVATQEAAPAAGSLSGSWKIDMDVAGEAHSGTCTIQQDGEKLSGSCKTETGEHALTGEVRGQTATWSHKGEYNGEALTVSYKGSVELATTLKGDIDIQPMGVAGTFTATRAQ